MEYSFERPSGAWILLAAIDVGSLFE